MEELELHCRRRGRYDFRKIKIATISVRMVSFGAGCPADVHADIHADVLGQKLQSGPGNPGKKQAFWCGHPYPKAQKSMTTGFFFFF